MCGILGYSGDGRKFAFEQALAQLGHRGPDASEVKYFGGRSAFGHRRLSIIDPHPSSNQPFTVNQRHWIVYNGELFNYIELRDELKASGINFTTDSDTEVVLQSYLRWGSDCVKRFNGMWAFVIIDTQDHSLFGSRDRFGEKPFSYAQLGHTLFFASEMKAILTLVPELAEPNERAIANYCRSSIGAQHASTWFKGIKRLQPGTNLFWKGNQLRLERYWSYPQGGSSKLSLEDATEQYRSIFIDSVKLRLRSDVPVGLTLSSGLDSTAIAWAMRGASGTTFNSYTADFDESHFSKQEKKVYNTSQNDMSEGILVKRLARDWDIENHQVVINYDDYVHSLSEVVWHLEGGNSSPAVIPNLQVMKRARKDVTVVLEGQGADELLGGYTVANIIYSLHETMRDKGVTTAYEELKDFQKVYAFAPAVLLYIRQQMVSSAFVNNLYRSLAGPLQALSYEMRIQPYETDAPLLIGEEQQSPLLANLKNQHSGGLVNLLHYGDAMSMAASVEARNPFLDYRLVEFAWTLPAHYKVQGSKGKIIHRAAMQQHLPDYILNRPKLGFATPVTRIFNGEYRCHTGETPVEVLTSKRCKERGIVDPEGLDIVLKSQRRGDKDHGYFLFRLLSTELWYRKFIDKTVM